MRALIFSVYLVAGFVLGGCALLVTSLVYGGLDRGAGIIRCALDISKCAN